MTAAEARAFTEHLLSGAIGAASARIVMASAQGRNLLSPRAARAMLGEASEAIRQNLDLLRTTLDHVSQGIGVFDRSEEHTSELQSLMRISYAVFCLKKKIQE